MPLSQDVVIANQRGLHARASALFVRQADGYKSKITVSSENGEVGGTSIMGLMMLAASIGTTITITTNGVDEEEALAGLVSLVEAKFHEE
jgi:phosphocarrier protein